MSLPQYPHCTYLAVRISISSSANLRPTHILGPYPNGKKANGCCVCSSGHGLLLRYLSGINSLGRLKNCSDVEVKWEAMAISVNFLNWYPAITVSTGKRRAVPTTVGRKREASFMQARKYGMFFIDSSVKIEFFWGRISMISLRRMACLSGLLANA